MSAFIHHPCAGPGHMLHSVVGTHSHWAEPLSSQLCQVRRGTRIGVLAKVLVYLFSPRRAGAASGQGAGDTGSAKPLGWRQRPEGQKGWVGTGCRASMGQARGRVGADAGPPRTRLVATVRGGACYAGPGGEGKFPGKLLGFQPVQGLTLASSRGGTPRFGALCWDLLSQGGDRSTPPQPQSGSRQACMGKERARMDRPVSKAWWLLPRGRSGTKGRRGFGPQSQHQVLPVCSPTYPPQLSSCPAPLPGLHAWVGPRSRDGTDQVPRFLLAAHRCLSACLQMLELPGNTL